MVASTMRAQCLLLQGCQLQHTLRRLPQSTVRRDGLQDGTCGQPRGNSILGAPGCVGRLTQPLPQVSSRPQALRPCSGGESQCADHPPAGKASQMIYSSDLQCQLSDISLASSAVIHYFGSFLGRKGTQKPDDLRIGYHAISSPGRESLPCSI